MSRTLAQDLGKNGLCGIMTETGAPPVEVFLRLKAVVQLTGLPEQ
jgi:hypothetical protein